MSKPKRDFANLTALISSGESDVEARRLSVVPADDAMVSAATREESHPTATAPAATVATPLSDVAPATNPDVGRRVVQKLSIQLTEETILALYARQLAERAKHRKRGDTTIGWVADSLLRQALGLPALNPG
jgi:hypothetical protein